MACKSRVPEAIMTLVRVFKEYASKESEGGAEEESGMDKVCIDQFKLNKNELKEIVQNELDMDEVNNPAELDMLMKRMDDDGDGQVDFLEFVAWLTKTACVHTDFMQQIQEEEQSQCDQAKSE